MNKSGFTHIFVIFIIFALLATASLIVLYSPKTQPALESYQNIDKISWQFDRNSGKWNANTTPPDCPKPLAFPAPADVNLASSILYPGQVRSTDYKPHGGFRFDNLKNNLVDVYAPMDGNLVKAARHLEFGEIQYALYFINDCGIMYKLDHLRVLTDRFEKIINKIPQGGEGDSRTTQINPIVFVAKGEHVATEVGFRNNRNIFFDFGVYDLRRTNKAKENDEYKSFALCWLDYLEEPARSIVKSLPGADSVNGTNSDYCK